MPPRGGFGGGSDAETGVGTAPPPFFPRTFAGRDGHWGVGGGDDSGRACPTRRPLAANGANGPRPVAASERLDQSAVRSRRTDRMAVGGPHFRTERKGAMARLERRHGHRA